MYKGIACTIAFFVGYLLWGGLSNVCANGIKEYTLSTANDSSNSGVETNSTSAQSDKKHFVINRASMNARKALFDEHQYISQAYIEFDIRRIKNLQASDLVAFYVPQQKRSYMIVIEDIQQTKLGGLRIAGYFSDDAQRHIALDLQLDGRSVSGRLQTTKGEYLFRSHAQYGWIAAQYEGKKQYLKYPEEFAKPKEVVAKK